MNPIRKVIPLVFSLLLISSAFADSSCVTSIGIPGVDNTCQNSLDFSNHIDNNPFFVKDPNGLCGIGLSLPGLPNINFNGLNVNYNLDQFFCKLLKGPITKSVFDL